MRLAIAKPSPRNPGNSRNSPRTEVSLSGVPAVTARRLEDSMVRMCIVLVPLLWSAANAQANPESAQVNDPTKSPSATTPDWAPSFQYPINSYPPSWRRNLSAIETAKGRVAPIDLGIWGNQSPGHTAESYNYGGINVPSPTSLPPEDLSTTSRRLLDRYYSTKSLR